MLLLILSASSLRTRAHEIGRAVATSLQSPDERCGFIALPQTQERPGHDVEHFGDSTVARERRKEEAEDTAA